MNTYSRALRHINMVDVKQKHQQKLIEKKIKEEKERKNREFIVSVMNEMRYNWREKLLEDDKKYLEEVMTSSGMFQTTLPSTGDIEYSVTELDIVQSGGNLLLYYDTTVYNTLVFDVRATNGLAVGLFPYPDSLDSEPYLTTDVSGTYSITVPQSKRFVINFLRGEPAGYDPESGGIVAIDAVRAKRTVPLNVFVSLDSPEAVAFMRTDPMMANLSQKERLEKLKEMLAASDEYVIKALGIGFPGSGVVPPGEAGDTPGVEIIDYGTDLTPLSDNPYGTEVGQISDIYWSIKNGQVPYMKPEKAKQVLSDPKYQKLWDDDPDALRTVQRLAGA